jgi:hypothetical protein
MVGEALVRLEDRLIGHVRLGVGAALDRVEQGGMQPGRLASRSAHPLHRTRVAAAGRGHEPRAVRGPLTERSDLMTQKICFDCFHKLFPDKPIRKVTLGRQCVVCKAQTDRTEQMIPVEAEDIPLVKQIAQVPRLVLHRTERHADRRVAVRVAARGAGRAGRDAGQPGPRDPRYVRAMSADLDKARPRGWSCLAHEVLRVRASSSQTAIRRVWF